MPLPQNVKPYSKGDIPLGIPPIPRDWDNILKCKEHSFSGYQNQEIKPFPLGDIKELVHFGELKYQRQADSLGYLAVLPIYRVDLTHFETIEDDNKGSRPRGDKYWLRYMHSHFCFRKI
jgi:hypothetical protein